MRSLLMIIMLSLITGSAFSQVDCDLSKSLNNVVVRIDNPQDIEDLDWEEIRNILVLNTENDSVAVTIQFEKSLFNGSMRGLNLHYNCSASQIDSIISKSRKSLLRAKTSIAKSY